LVSLVALYFAFPFFFTLPVAFALRWNWLSAETAVRAVTAVIEPAKYLARRLPFYMDWLHDQSTWSAVEPYWDVLQREL